MQLYVLYIGKKAHTKKIQKEVVQTCSKIPSEAASSCYFYCYYCILSVFIIFQFPSLSLYILAVEIIKVRRFWCVINCQIGMIPMNFSQPQQQQQQYCCCFCCFTYLYTTFQQECKAVNKLQRNLSLSIFFILYFYLCLYDLQHVHVFSG